MDFERTLPNAENVGSLTAQDLTREATAIPSPAHNILDRHPILGQSDNDSVGFLAPEISLILDPLGSGEQIGIGSPELRFAGGDCKPPRRGACSFRGASTTAAVVTAATTAASADPCWWFSGSAAPMATEAGSFATRRGNPGPAACETRAPELNPVENVWQFLRGNWLSNLVFETSTTSSTPLRRLPQTSSPSQKPSPQSECANGPTSVRPHDSYEHACLKPRVIRHSRLTARRCPCRSPPVGENFLPTVRLVVTSLMGLVPVPDRDEQQPDQRRGRTPGHNEEVVPAVSHWGPGN